MHFIDSHCHLNYPKLQEDFEGVLSRAAAAQVAAMLTIGVKLDDIQALIAITEQHPNIFATIGVHPHDSEKTHEVLVGQTLNDALTPFVAHPKVVGIGETGLDYYYDHSDRALQRQSFEDHITLAQQHDLPLVIHTRGADEDTIAILKAAGPLRGVLHCFSGSGWLLEQGLDLGLYVSASGIITFKKSEELRHLFKAVPMDRLLIETDAPYLAPEPYRGRSNEPSFVVHVAERLASIKELALSEIANHTTLNFKRLFSKCVLPF